MKNVLYFGVDVPNVGPESALTVQEISVSSDEDIEIPEEFNTHSKQVEIRFNVKSPAGDNDIVLTSKETDVVLVLIFSQDEAASFIMLCALKTKIGLKGKGFWE